MNFGGSLGIELTRFLFFILFLLGHVSAEEFGVSVSSYLGDAGNADSVRGVRILSDGKIVLAANLGSAAPGGTVTLLNGASGTTPGAILRLSGDGKTVLSVTRVAAEVRDLAVDANDNLYVAAANDGAVYTNQRRWHRDRDVLGQNSCELRDKAFYPVPRSGAMIHRQNACSSERLTSLKLNSPSADTLLNCNIWNFQPIANT